MSTSDQQGQGPLTRKQLREIRMTGATPVITEEEAAAVAAPPAPLPRAAEPIEIPPAPVVEPAAGEEPLTRRQVRERERVRTASVPVLDPDIQSAREEAAAEPEQEAAAEPEAEAVEPESVEPDPAGPEATDSVVEAAEPVLETPADDAEPEKTEDAETDSAHGDDIVTSVPGFAGAAPTDAEDARLGDEEIAITPVSAATAAEAVGEIPLDSEEEHFDVDALSAEQTDADSADADSDEARPTVSPAFGQEVLKDEAVSSGVTPSFDELLTVGDSTGSQHVAPSALIFTPAPGEGSLSGPVASTGEVLVTGSYELPRGLGSQGHAHGTTDGKDIDAVLIDGELPPASSPTPIAASAAISTSKSAGEVIRPPAPDKGNKLMLALAITAGGLALAVAVTLVIAFSMNVLN